MASDFSLKSHDRLPSIQATLSVGGLPVDLTLAVSLKFIMTNATTNAIVVNHAATMVAPLTSGVVRYDWQAADTTVPGNYLGEWEVTWATGKQTFPTLTYHTIQILADLDNA